MTTFPSLFTSSAETVDPNRLCYNADRSVGLLDSNRRTSRKIWDCHIRVTASFAPVILSGKHDENIKPAELVVFLGHIEVLGDPSRLGFEIDGGPPWPSRPHNSRSANTVAVSGGAREIPIFRFVTLLGEASIEMRPHSVYRLRCRVGARRRRERPCRRLFRRQGGRDRAGKDAAFRHSCDERRRKSCRGRSSNR